MGKVWLWTSVHWTALIRVQSLCFQIPAVAAEVGFNTDAGVPSAFIHLIEWRHCRSLTASRCVAQLFSQDVVLTEITLLYVALMKNRTF